MNTIKQELSAIGHTLAKKADQLFQLRIAPEWKQNTSLDPMDVVKKSEAIANLMLALRHCEDARNRCIQAVEFLE